MIALKHFFVAFVSFIVLDFLWFGFVVNEFNQRHLAEIGRIENGKFQILYAPAVATYVLMALAVAIFLAPRVSPDAPLWQAFLWGALMGLIVYGVFDMTNLAILKNYSLQFALADMAWGSFVFGVISVLVRKI